MMKIIKNGKPKEIQFCCPSCGCEFIANAKKCDFSMVNTIHINFTAFDAVVWTANCPNCKYKCKSEECIEHRDLLTQDLED